MKVESSLLEQAEGLKEELTGLRRKLHSLPELGFEEYLTSGLAADYLQRLGLEVTKGVAKTGVVALLKGELPGSTVMLRADMDALPIQEENELEARSEIDGRMHACGHDAHTAILLGAARLLLNNKHSLKGTVKFVFQPAEEYVQGAKAMIAEGVLSAPEVDMALSLHVSPDVESGHIQIKEGIMLSSMDEFEITLQGRGGHGSNPQNTIDPIVAGAQLVTGLQTIVSRRIAPFQPAVVSVCQFISGTKSNIIPSQAYLSGTVRCQDEAVRNEILRQIDTITKGICDASGATYLLKTGNPVPPVYNDRKMLEDFVNCSRRLLDSSRIEFLDRPHTYSEDFAFFAEKVPSLYFFLGTRNRQKGCCQPTHSAGFKLDEEILPLGAALFANYCLNRGR